MTSVLGAASISALTSRPSMTLSLYHSPNPNSPLHPIHLLPPELVVHVFMLGSVDDVMFPVLVSHVCHSWRSIALHAYSLWRRVSLSPGSNLDMWKERIYRARSCTLDIALMSGPCLELSHDMIALQMHLLAPHLSRSRSLDIQFDRHTLYLWNAALGPLCRPSSSLWDCQYFSSYDLPGCKLANQLEALTLRYPRNDDTKEFTLFGGFAPRLVRLTIQGIHLTWLPDLFGRLVYLDYTHHGFSNGQAAVNEILSMLQISCRLRDLRFCFVTKVERQESRLVGRFPANEVATLPFLESLSLRIDNADVEVPPELTTIVSRLHVPTLKTLHMLDPQTVDGSRHHTPFARLPALFDGLSLRAPSTTLSDLIVEGRWVEPLLLSSLVTQSISLKTIVVNGITQMLK
ncbi:hypothetical protein F5I97DRAFT_1377786 [Phlebopus sp. FC_14]|nr:hypothetical protein F5I97DRAFT_1377786 [Phlebopus sp. FC_14]